MEKGYYRKFFSTLEKIRELGIAIIIFGLLSQMFVITMVMLMHRFAIRLDTATSDFLNLIIIFVTGLWLVLVVIWFVFVCIAPFLARFSFRKDIS